MDIIWTLLGIGIGWAMVIWLDRNVFNKNRYNNRNKGEQSMDLMVFYICVGVVLYVLGTVGWSFLSLVYTWFNCKLEENQWK